MSLPPLFFRIVCSVALFLAACSHSEERAGDAELLARVGDVEIRLSDVRSLEEKLGDQGPQYSVGENVRTLVDRQVLLLEAQLLGLSTDSEIQQLLAVRSTQALADAMMRRNVDEQIALSQSDIAAAYARDGWNQRVNVEEIYVPTGALADQVVQALDQGIDFSEVARRFARDPALRIATGMARQMAYSPFEEPQELVNAAFAKNAGQVTEPIALRGGFVIALVRGRQEVPLQAVEQGIRAALERQMRRQLRQSYLRHLKWDMGTDYHPEGMQLAVAVLRGDKVLDALKEEQRHAPVYTFEGVEMDVAEVVAVVRPSGQRWADADADAVNQKLAQDHFPSQMMAQDARRKGVDKSPSFLAWYENERENLMLLKLRGQIVEKVPEPSEDELQAFYEGEKQRFRSAAWAKLIEILVEQEDQAQALVARIQQGEDMAELMRQHSLRDKAAHGVMYVSESQAPFYGEEWIGAIMQAPLEELVGPLKTRGGYSLIKVLEREAEVYHGLDDPTVRRSVLRDVRLRLQREFFEVQMQALRDKHAGQISVYQEAIEQFE